MNELDKTLFTKEERLEYEFNCKLLDEKVAKKILMEDKYLSELSYVEVRNLFIGRLVNCCRFIVKKEYAIKNCPNDCDYMHFEMLEMFLKEDSVKVKVYGEIILSMTSEDLETIPDILNELGYDEDIYYKFIEIVKKYKK